MFSMVLELIKDCFVCAFQVCDSIIVVGNASVLDFYIVFFITSLLLTSIIGAFGGGNIATAGSSAIRSVKKEKESKQNNKTGKKTRR